jgi:hypothetical protein
VTKLKEKYLSLTGYTLAEGEPTTISVTSVYGNPEGLSSRQGIQL